MAWLGNMLWGGEVEAPESESEAETKRASPNIDPQELRRRRLDHLATLERRTPPAAAPSDTPDEAVAPSLNPSSTTISRNGHENAGVHETLASSTVNGTELSLEHVLQFTVRQLGSSKLVHLESSFDSLSEHLSEALFCRLSSSLPLQQGVFQYLGDCYERAALRGRTCSPQTKQTLTQLKDIICNYAATSLAEPDMFPRDSGISPKQLLAKFEFRSPTQRLFLLTTVEVLEKQGEATRILQPLLEQLVQNMRQQSLATGTTAAALLTTLTAVKSVARAFAELPSFEARSPMIRQSGRAFQFATALGPFFSLDCTGQDVISQYFANPSRRSRQQVDRSIVELRRTLEHQRSHLHRVVVALCKAAPRAKNGCLDWLETAITLSSERLKSNPNMSICSSEGFSLNVISVVLRLCSPFARPSSPKLRLIDSSFLGSDTRLIPLEELRLCPVASSRSVDGSTFNFITRLFFLGTRGLHTCVIAAIRSYNRLHQQLGYLQQHMAQNAVMEAQFHRMIEVKLATDAQLLDPELLGSILQFTVFSAHWIVQQCCPPAEDGAGEGAELTLPLPTPTLPRACAIPLHMLEDVVDVTIFIARHAPSVLDSVVLAPLMDFIVAFLASPSYISSPHLRAKFGELLFDVFVPSNSQQTKSVSFQCQNLITQHPLAKQFLAPSLMSLYGDVENTGFYEKLSHRFKIARILKYLWQFPAHRDAFIFVSSDSDRFVRFVNGILNHSNSLLTESLSKLPEIREVQLAMGDSALWLSQDDASRREQEEKLAENERSVTSSLLLANETVHMLCYMTESIKEPFTVPELVQRLASMLNIVFLKLAGPNGVQLKVQHPEKYNFKPRIMLREIAMTFLNLSAVPSFADAVALDGLFDGAILAKVASLISREGILSSTKIEEFLSFSESLQAIKELHQEQETALGEIPDEFLDPLLCSLMTDPVKLPSGVSVERSVILQHLLNEETDPFSRAHLTPAMLVPDDELRTKIEEWLAAQSRSR